MKKIFNLFLLLCTILTVFIVSGCGDSDIPLPENDSINISSSQESEKEDSTGNESSECAHQYSEKVLVNATCQKEGVGKKTCSLCGESKNTSIPKSSHIEVIEEAIPATCTASGKTEGKHCSVCNTVLVAQEITNPIDHIEVIDKAIPATCTSTGVSEGTHCGTCNTTLVRQEAIPTIPHSTEKVVIKQVTCKENGEVGNKCTVCKNIIGDLEIIEKGHFPEGYPHSEIEGLYTVSTKGYCNCCENYLIEPGIYTIGSLGSWTGTAQFKFEYYNNFGVKQTANQITRSFDGNYKMKFNDFVAEDRVKTDEDMYEMIDFYEPVITITEENFAVVSKSFYNMFLQCFEEGEYYLSGTYEFTDYITFQIFNFPDEIIYVNFKYLDTDDNEYHSEYIQKLETTDGPQINYSTFGNVLYFSYSGEYGAFTPSLQRSIIFESPQKVPKKFFEWFVTVANKVII